jgi:CBS domain-containing protein
MTYNPACCTPDTTLNEVARMMEQNDCGCIPIVSDMSGMKPVGTITDRDIAIRAVAAGQNPATMKASDIMTASVASVRPEQSLEEVFDVMEDREIRRVLVVDEQGRCCGIVAQADVVQSTANPTRTNQVIREISESSPSRNLTSWTGRRSSGQYDRGRSSYGSMMSTGSLVPFFAGLGSGVALMYIMDNWNSRSDIDYGRTSIGSGAYDYQNRFSGGTENFGKYADAEEEVEKRQIDLADRVESLKTEPDSPVNARNTKDKSSGTSGGDKGMSAGQR